MHPILLVAVALTSAVLSAGGPVTLRSVTPVCNGHAELCNRSYSNITFAGSHDSFAFSKDPLVLARDQEVDIPTQLSTGIRLLQAQSHMGFDDQLHFCHTDCFLFDGGTVAAYLEDVVTFLNDNPTDVLTLLFTNPEGLSFTDVWAPVFEEAGVVNWAYVPPQNPMPYSAWPTLGDMIASGKRLVVFIDYVGKDGSMVDYLLPEFGMIWESPFDMTNASFPCSIDRIRGPLSASDQMYLINHNLDFGKGNFLLANRFAAKTTNGISSIINHANGCAPLGSGRYPNFVLLDWVDVGQASAAVDQLNGLLNVVAL